MERVPPPIITNTLGYAKVRLLEALEEAEQSLRFLKEGFTRNSAQKAFMAWKAFISCLVAINIKRLPRDEKEEKWYLKTGFLAPTTGLNGISQRLEELGYVNMIPLTSLALKLHRYAYNGLYKGASDYYSRDEVKGDVRYLISAILRLSKEWASQLFDEEIQTQYEKVQKMV